MINNNRKRIFISSVQSEFQHERRQLAKYIRQDALFGQYFDTFLFEDLPAQDKSAKSAYLEQASNADVYLVLIGEKYGFEDNNGISPTEREYDAATFHNVYRLAFIKDVENRQEKEELFKHKIDNDVIRNTFGSYEELQNNLYASLIDYMIKNNLLQDGPFDTSVHPFATFNDLDKAKIRWFVGMAREKRQFPIQYSDENIHQILDSLHLITDNGKVKNAALLLFAKDVQKWFASATIKCAQFYGTRVQKPILSQQIYGGNVFDMIDQAVGFVMSRINQRVGERVRSAQVDVTPELPAQAVTEAIVNAVVHRDYDNTGSVQVMLFKDRLEVWNPGRLPKGMTIKKLSGMHSSRPVNPVLANSVYLAGYIEQMGTGTTDIIDSCAVMNLKTPEFYQDDDFCTIIWREDIADTETDTKENVSQNVNQNVNQNVSQKDKHKIGKRQQNILKIVGNNIYITAEEVAKKLKVNPRTVYRDLKVLHITWSGPAKSGHWVFGK